MENLRFFKTRKRIYYIKYPNIKHQLVLQMFFHLHLKQYGQLFQTVSRVLHRTKLEFIFSSEIDKFMNIFRLKIVHTKHRDLKRPKEFSVRSPQRRYLHEIIPLRTLALLVASIGS